MIIRSLLASIFASLLVFTDAVVADTASDYLDYSSDPDWDVTVPRGNTVNVDFTVDEATMSSVDISPDGKWVVFDLLGHIYRVSTRGGEAEVLTQDSGIAINFHPRISNKGDKIAFISDRNGQNNLWVINLDGSNPKPVFLDPNSRLSSPDWAHDDSAIYAERNFPTYSLHRRSVRLWRFPYKGAGDTAREITGQLSGYQSQWPSVSGDGKSLYFMYSTFPSYIVGRQKYQHIQRLDLASGATMPVTPAGGLNPGKSEAFTELAPEVSPDGRWLAFARRIPDTLLEYRGHTVRHRTALWLLDLKSGAERIVMDPITRDTQKVHGMKIQKVVPGYSWAADSKSLVISEGGKIRRLWIDSGKVDTIPFHARVQRVASEQTRARNQIKVGPVAAKTIRWPQVTADQKTVFFQAVGRVWKQTLPAGNAEAIATAGNEDMQLMPALSPDGKTLAWVSWNDVELGQVWTMSTAGGKPRQMSKEGGTYMYPFWSPEGALYVIRGGSTDPAAIATAHPTGFGIFKVTKKGKLDRVADAAPLPVAFGPRGKLYWLDASTAAWGGIQKKLEQGKPIPEIYSTLHSMPIGGTPSTHMRFTAASWAAPTFDGKQVLFREGDEIYLTPFERSQARYLVDKPKSWQGRQTPYNIVKEDPREPIAQISFGGSVDPRWLDNTHLVYGQGNTVKVYDTASGNESAYKINLTIGREPADKTLALTNARLITHENGHVVKNGTLVIEGNTIHCVGHCDTSAADTVLDMSGKTIIPSFVDVHAHGFGGGTELIGSVHGASAAYLAYGVTTTLDPSVDTTFATMLAELSHAGRIPGPRIYTTGNITLPLSPFTGPRSYQDAEQQIHANAMLGAVSTKIYLSPRRDQRQMFVEASRKFGMSATNEGADLLSDIASVLDGSTGFEHAMNLLPAYSDVAQFFGQLKTVYSPTLIVSTANPTAEEYFASHMRVWQRPKQQRFLPWEHLATEVNYTRSDLADYDFPVYAESVKDILNAGGYAAIGGHGQHTGMSSHWEVWSYSSAMPELQALEMASMGGARMLGAEGQLGSLRKGKLADLIILDANPLEDIRNTLDIHAVVKDGVLYDDDTLDERWPEENSRRVPQWVQPDVFQAQHTRSVGHWDQ